MAFVFLESRATPSLPILPDIHPYFYYRDIFPLQCDPTQISLFSWWFQQLPPIYRGYFKKHAMDVMKIHKYFIYAFSYMKEWPYMDPRNPHPASSSSSTTRSIPKIFYLIIEASAFASFVQAMEQYIYTPTHVSAFLLPFSWICLKNPLVLGNTGSIHNAISHHTIDEFHRHLFVVARDGEHFIENCYMKMNQNANESPAATTSSSTASAAAAGKTKIQELDIIGTSFFQLLLEDECTKDNDAPVSFPPRYSDIVDCTSLMSLLNI